MNNSIQHLSRLEKEHARKHVKRACETSVEKTGERKSIGKKASTVELLSQKLNVYSRLLLVSSEMLIVELLNQKLNMYSALLLVNSDRLIIEHESEAEHEQHLADGQQRQANRRASESETEHAHRLAANQQ